jgi:hypothetical protein
MQVLHKVKETAMSKNHSVIIDGELIPGKFVRGLSMGGRGKNAYRAEWDGYYVGSWNSDNGVLYHYFENGHIRDSFQRVHGFPAEQVDGEQTGTVVPLGNSSSAATGCGSLRTARN